MKTSPKDSNSIHVSEAKPITAAALGRRVAFFCVTALSSFQNALADSNQSKKDMLTPEEVPLETSHATGNNKSGPFIGATGSFGQGRPTEGNSSAGIATLFKLEPGYQIGTGSWSRVEISGEILGGSLGFRQSAGPLTGKHRMNLDLGFLAKFGYGYSLGHKMFGIVKVGAGSVSGKLRASANGQTVESDRTTGTALLLGWTMVLPVAQNFDFTGGLGLLHCQFDVGSLASGPASYDYGRSLLVNVPTIDLGMRIKL